MKKIIFIVLMLLLAGQFYVNNAQQKPVEQDVYKKAAIDHMNAGRYGEAIAMLEKYTSTYPRLPDGYYLRGLCREKRAEYYPSIIALRRAVSLCDDSQAKEKAEYQKALDRVIGIYHPLLYKKIEGHQREIAIDPSKPFNYLEIGKSYRYLEIWPKAEEWYDEYLKRYDKAPPDDILSYTEILSETRHIEKGEKILKKYVEAFPADNRLWSRYGYYALWLAKYKIAKSAFENALKLKPFFKEALDGLDRVNREAYVDQIDPRINEKEFPIDKYTRLLKRNPNDDDMRYKLIEELIKFERIEEAYTQLGILRTRVQNDPKIEGKWKFVETFRDSVYKIRIAEFKTKLEKDPTDKTAIKGLVDYYEYLKEFSSAIAVLDSYFEKVPDEKDQELRLRYARLNAWQKNTDKALSVLDKLLEDHPNNLDGQLLKGQVLSWLLPNDPRMDTVAARILLEKVLAKRPNNIEAIISMGFVKIAANDFEDAMKWADKAKAIETSSDRVIQLYTLIDERKGRYEEYLIEKIRYKAQEFVVAGDPLAAIPYYQEYISKAAPNILVLREFGDVSLAAKKYDDAIKLYDQVLVVGYDSIAAYNRTKAQYFGGDSLHVVPGFIRAAKERPEDPYPRFFLAGAYTKLKQYDSARVVLDTLSSWKTLDSTKRFEIKQMYSWIPVTGLRAILATFPNYIGIAPSAYYYADNISFRIFTAGGRLELGVAQFLALGASFYRTRVSAKAESIDQDELAKIEYFTGDQTFTTFKGHIFLTLSDYVKLGTGIGKVSSGYLTGRDDIDAYFKVEDEKTNVYKILLTYQNTDALLLLYSPFLIDTRLYAQSIKLQGHYNTSSGLGFSGYYSYVNVSDGNAGNDLQLRIGRTFYEYIFAGYEYFYSNYRYKLKLYYTPQNFESHSLFFTANLEKSPTLKVNLEGKIGYIPNGNLLNLLGSLEGKYTPSKQFSLIGKVTLSSTSRDASSYRYFALELSAYWAINPQWK